jgi:acyl carrier protein
MNNIEERIISVIRENMPDRTLNIEKESELICNLGFDSVRLMGMLYSLEEEFQIEIINGENNFLFFSITNVQDLIDVMNTILD